MLNCFSWGGVWGAIGISTITFEKQQGKQSKADFLPIEIFTNFFENLWKG